MITTNRACWLMVSAYLLTGCSSLSKLFSSSDTKTTPDAAGVTSDAAWAMGGLDAPGSLDLPFVGVMDAAPAGGLDSAPAVSMPEPSPPSLAVEAPAITATTSSLRAALTTRNFDAAAAQFTAEVRARYRATFANAAPDKLDQLAAALAQIDVRALATGSVKRTELRAEAAVMLDGRTFHVGLIKHDNQWLVESL